MPKEVQAAVKATCSTSTKIVFQHALRWALVDFRPSSQAAALRVATHCQPDKLRVQQ